MIEREILDEAFEKAEKLKYFDDVLAFIQIIEDAVRQTGSFIIEKEAAGDKEDWVIDGQVVQAMKGGALFIYRDLVSMGLKEDANEIVKKYVPPDYEPVVNSGIDKGKNK